jgi:LmbE family N-acetylglucosaminyl deacetylase
MAGSPLYFPGTGDAHRVATLLLSGTLEPDCWVDISDTLATKLAAVACHRSQLPAGDRAAVESVVEEMVRVRAEDAGSAAGLPLAEGFRRLALAGA